MPKGVESLSELLRDTQSVKATKGDVMSDTLDSDCRVHWFFHVDVFFAPRSNEWSCGCIGERGLHQARVSEGCR